MQTPEIAPSESQHLKRTALMLAAGWSITISLVFGWHLWGVKKHALESARIQAELSFEKDVVYRRWAAIHGGVYVPPTAETPPNPYLSHLPHRDVTTTSGQDLTLVNPAYMTRQVHELGESQYGHRGHITSLNPLRPENAPDAWEAEALRAIEQGKTEVLERTSINGVDYTRLMRPLTTEASCLKCHAEQGYEVGDVRGGVSVSVPMEPLWASAHRHIVAIVTGYLLIWLLGLLGIGIATRHTRARIRERVQSAVDLRESEERFRTLFESSRDAIMTLEPPSWRFTAGNPACVAMFGARDEAHFTSLGPWEWSPEFQPDGRPSGDKAREMIETAMAEGSNFFEWTHRRVDGEDFPATVLLTRVELGDRQFLQATVRDISERKRLEAERRGLERQVQEKQKQAAVGVLACGMGHEINNPIMGIMNYAQLIKDGLQGKDNELEEFAGEIAVEAQRIAGIVRGLSAFASRDTTSCAPVPVGDLLESALTPTRDALTRDHVTLEVDLPADLPAVACDRGQIEQVLTSLISNARDALNEKYAGHHEDKKITITVRVPGNAPGGAASSTTVPHTQTAAEDIGLFERGTGNAECGSEAADSNSDTPRSDFRVPRSGSRMLRLTVEDHGTGIPSEVREHIFEPFFTTKDTNECRIGWAPSLSSAFTRKPGRRFSVVFGHAHRRCARKHGYARHRTLPAVNRLERLPAEAGTLAGMG